MDVVKCISCHTNVFPRGDGTCPSCGASTSRSEAVQPLSEAELAVAAARDEQPRDALQLASRHTALKKAQTYIAIGVLLLIAGVGFTLHSYQTAESGGQFTILSGGIVAGLYFLIKGFITRSEAS